MEKKFCDRLEQLKREHEKLLALKNEPVAESNGIISRLQLSRSYSDAYAFIMAL
jgi:hypothetical protein